MRPSSKRVLASWIARALPSPSLGVVLADASLVVTVEYDEQPSLLLLMLLLGRRLLLMVENTLSSNKYEDPSAHCFCCLCLLLLCFCVDVQCASVFIFVSVSVPLSYQYQPPTYLLRYICYDRAGR